MATGTTAAKPTMNCKLILAQSGDLTGNCRWKDQDYPLHLQRRP